jgi:transcriptional regulator of acetoin/glycerol metabolism
VRGRAVADGWERGQLERTLSQTAWNVAKTATLLGVSRRTLFNRIERFGLKRPARA